jgi:hypothetical protein
MTALLLRDEVSGARWQVWPDGQPLPPGSVQETGSYLFELRDDAENSDAGLLIDDMVLEGLRPSGGAIARWRWAPGFHAGTVEAELRLPGQPARRFELVTDPDRRKLTRDDFGAMVRELRPRAGTGEPSSTTTISTRATPAGSFCRRSDVNARRKIPSLLWKYGMITAIVIMSSS